MSNKACEGGLTKSVRTSERMEECLVCHTMVRVDKVDDPFFGFKAGCGKTDDEWYEHEEDGPLDLEDQLERAMDRAGMGKNGEQS